MDFRSGDFFYASPERALHASGIVDTVAEADPDELVALVGKALLESGAPLAAGMLPFDVTAPAHLVVPTSVRWSAPSPAPSSLPPHRVVFDDPAAYRAAVAEGVERLRAPGDLRKVVLARTLDLAFDADVDVAGLLPELLAANPHGYTFAAPLPSGATMVGATPELLLARRGAVVTCNPLAGSLPRWQDPAVLLDSAKNLEEHRVVVESVVEALSPFCRDLRVPDAPALVATPSVWHLSTHITGELVDTGVSALRLAAALHPTPAVCGTPPDAARSVIAELEPFDRGFYAGAVGWCDADGDGEWAVAIRCAEVDGPSMRLYAGCGIMPDSDPDTEVVETVAKFGTMLGALGLGGAHRA